VRGLVVGAEVGAEVGAVVVVVAGGAEYSVRWLGTVASALGVASAGFTVVIVMGTSSPWATRAVILRAAGALTDSNAISPRIVPGLRRISARHGGSA
jgi:hypothetical protein